MKPTIYAIGTLDTKGSELNWVAEKIRNTGHSVTIVDVGTLGPPTITPDFSREQVLADQQLPASSHRGDSIRIMGEALRGFLTTRVANNEVAGIVGIGGSGGTSLITTALRELPIGLPKVMVSTVASGNTAPYVDCSDITMMYSVVDVAGLNAVSKAVLGNAAHAIAGMVEHRQLVSQEQRTVGMTMFGVTTPCVNHVRESLEQSGYDCLVFHATGTGGRAMERLTASNFISGVLDITATEVADEIAGGVMPAGSQRYDILIEKKIPLVVSLGAIDMVNFGGIETVPDHYRNRKLHVHNPQVTLMRTSRDENVKIGKWIAEKLNRGDAPWTLLIPEKGVSSISVLGQPFHDPEADAACFETLEAELKTDEHRKIIRVDEEINSPSFSMQLVQEFEKLVG